MYGDRIFHGRIATSIMYYGDALQRAKICLGSDCVSGSRIFLCTIICWWVVVFGNSPLSCQAGLSVITPCGALSVASI